MKRHGGSYNTRRGVDEATHHWAEAAPQIWVREKGHDYR